MRYREGVRSDSPVTPDVPPESKTPRERPARGVRGPGEGVGSLDRSRELGPLRLCVQFTVEFYSPARNTCLNLSRVFSSRSRKAPANRRLPRRDERRPLSTELLWRPRGTSTSVSTVGP